MEEKNKKQKPVVLWHPSIVVAVTFPLACLVKANTIQCSYLSHIFI